MAYEYPIETSAVFEDRAEQMESFGISRSDIDDLRTRITDMWANAPGGWVYEWSKLGAQYAAANKPYTASVVYGWAKFPCLADEPKREAMVHQIEQYVAAAPTFHLRFERRVLSLPYRDKTVNVAVHLLGGPEDRKTAPILVASGGVDTWKMDGHPLFTALAKGTGFTVLAFDHPGTGETQVPLNAGADEVVLGIIHEARKMGDGRVAHFGMSFGGNFAAMTGLSGAVDAAINLGGPVDAALEEENLHKLPFGMPDILGNAFGFDHRPEFQDLVKGGAGLSRRQLLQTRSNSPMLVINGADDYFVPQADTLVFEGRANIEVHLLPGTGHCAISKMHEVMPAMIGWLRLWASKSSK